MALGKHVVVARYGWPVSRETETTRTSPVSRPMRQRQPQFKIPKIDTDTASRDRLIEHIEELEWTLEGLFPDDQDITALRTALGITRQQAKILFALAKGRVTSRDHIAAVAAVFKDDVSRTSIDVQVMRMRRTVASQGIVILSVWGIGYRLDPVSVPLVQSILNREV